MDYGKGPDSVTIDKHGIVHEHELSILVGAIEIGWHRTASDYKLRGKKSVPSTQIRGFSGRQTNDDNIKDKTSSSRPHND